MNDCWPHSPVPPHPAQAKPIRLQPITIVVRSRPGGPTDLVAPARRIWPCEGHGRRFQAVVVGKRRRRQQHHRRDQVAAPHDGHTLLLFHIGMAATPALYRRLPHNAAGDFEYLGMASDVPMVVVGKPVLANTYRDSRTTSSANRHRQDPTWPAGLGSASHICAACCGSRPADQGSP